MDIVSIEKFLKTAADGSKVVNVHFKDRPIVTGIFVNTGDYQELKSKNFWRIVNIKNIAQWKKTEDPGISRMYNGASFTRLSGHTTQ